MNAMILKGAALRQPPLPQSGPRAKTIAHPCPIGYIYIYIYSLADLSSPFTVYDGNDPLLQV
jgi:hypothetical protein